MFLTFLKQTGPMYYIYYISDYTLNNSYKIELINIYTN